MKFTYNYDTDLFTRCLRTEEHREALRILGFNVHMPGEWTKEHVLSILKLTREEAEVPMKTLYEVVTGNPTGLPLPEMLVIMGRDRFMKRLYDMTCWELNHPL